MQLIRKGLMAIAVLAVAGGLVGGVALAKKNPCGKDCKTQIASEFKTCKSACAKGKAGKVCKKECSDEKKAEKTACKAATSPTPPTCGFTDEESPSGAFLE